MGTTGSACGTSGEKPLFEWLQGAVCTSGAFRKHQHAGRFQGLGQVLDRLVGRGSVAALDENGARSLIFPSNGTFRMLALLKNTMGVGLAANAALMSKRLVWLATSTKSLVGFGKGRGVRWMCILAHTHNMPQQGHTPSTTPDVPHHPVAVHQPVATMPNALRTWCKPLPQCSSALPVYVRFIFSSSTDLGQACPGSTATLTPE